MKTIKQFFKYFEKERTNAEYILAFSQNKNTLNNEAFPSNSKNLEKLIQIKIHKYGHALANEREFKKLDNLIIELKKDVKRISKSKGYRILSEGVTFLEGKSLNYQKKYSKSNRIFKYLISKDNEFKQRYEKWYKYNLGGISDKLLWAVIFLCLLIMVVSFFKDFGNLFLNSIGGIVMIFTGIIQWIYKKYYLKI